LGVVQNNAKRLVFLTAPPRLQAFGPALESHSLSAARSNGAILASISSISVASAVWSKTPTAAGTGVDAGELGSTNLSPVRVIQ